MKKRTFHYPCLLLLIVCTCFFSTCAKEYSNEGGPKKYSAKYTLVGAGASCTGSVLAGKYYSGKALTSTNTIQIQVTVDSIGTYNITTNNVNGFSFSVTGSFTNTGPQTVTLTGGGTPATTGDFTFSATGNASTCTFSVTVTKEPVAMATLTIDCQNITVAGRLTSNTKLNAGNTITLKINVTAVGAYSITTDTLDGIYFTASGSFSSTGNKSIDLQGFGTPDYARNLVFTINGGTASCTCSVTVTDGDPLAVYVLESGAIGTSNVCMYTVAGTYTANTQLNSNNSVTIEVYVRDPGNFTIATDVVNGIMFAYSGTFAAAGDQHVTLQGSGTPTTVGTSSFVPQIVGPHPIGGESCGFSIPVK